MTVNEPFTPNPYRRPAGIAILAAVLLPIAAVLGWLGVGGMIDDKGDQIETVEPAGSKDVTSFCDEHGHRVYVTEDDVRSSPAVFVLANDCEVGR